MNMQINMVIEPYIIKFCELNALHWRLFFCCSSDLISAAADALLPLILCEKSLYQVCY